MRIDKIIEARRTFAIISHPDAGKTTLTEKLLLFGGAIQMAGSVKAKRSKKFATSDWMELEKKRGISVTSSVMNFTFNDHEINLIDTPGHQDFSEDTYRTLTAVDSALMLMDAGNGVEAQTKKLFQVCQDQKTPIIAFINKMDRDGKDPFELLDEIEKVLGIKTCPITWPVGMGREFQGVYDLKNKTFLFFDPKDDRSQKIDARHLPLEEAVLAKEFGAEKAAKLMEDAELISMAGDSFDHEAYLAGKLAPVFFGSAINNFGVERLLSALIELAPSPKPRLAKERIVEPDENKFTSFIFKIQANMDPKHRDRVAYMRIVSGKFERGMKAYVVRSKKEHRLGRPTQFMAQDRSLVDEAYAGDIVGIHDPGVFKIGDTLTQGESLNYTGIPVFAPEHFSRVVLKDPIKSKQLKKALDQLSEEGAVQVFRPVLNNDQILGVVGVLQFDVAKFRIMNEYGVDVDFQPLRFETARWVFAKEEDDMEKFCKSMGDLICMDQKKQRCILVDQNWRIKIWQERHEGIQFEKVSDV